MEMASILMMLVVIFVIARIFSSIIEKFGFPGLIGEIIAGIIISNLVIWNGDTIMDLIDIIPEDALTNQSGNENYSVLYTFSELGVIFLLFSVGLETRVKDLLGSGKTAMFVATLGVVVPFILGFVFIEVSDGNFHHAMFLAAAMVATSVGITARVIKDMGLMQKKASRIIISAAVIDDVLGMVVLAIVKGAAGSSGGIDFVDLAIIIIEACVFVIGVILFAKLGVPRVAKWWVDVNSKREKPIKIDLFFVSLVICLFFAWLAEEIGLASIIGAFLAGMIFADYAESHGMTNKVEVLTSFLISYFFVHVGMQVDLSTLSDVDVIVDCIIVIVIALISKYVGCGLGAKIADRALTKESLNIIGIGMMPRGEVGIIIAAIGLGIIVDGEPALSSELYAVIVIMAVATTIIAPPLLQRAFKKKYALNSDDDEEVE